MDCWKSCCSRGSSREVLPGVDKVAQARAGMPNFPHDPLGSSEVGEVGVLVVEPVQQHL